MIDRLYDVIICSLSGLREGIIKTNTLGLFFVAPFLFPSMHPYTQIDCRRRPGSCAAAHVVIAPRRKGPCWDLGGVFCTWDSRMRPFLRAATSSRIKVWNFSSPRSRILFASSSSSLSCSILCSLAFCKRLRERQQIYMSKE